MGRLSRDRLLSWYERRFRIECVFRECRGMLPRLCAKRAAWKFWWLCLSMVLYLWVNVYLVLRYKWCLYRGCFLFVVGLRLGDMCCLEVREVVESAQALLYTNKQKQKNV